MELLKEVITHWRVVLLLIVFALFLWWWRKGLAHGIKKGIRTAKKPLVQPSVDRADELSNHGDALALDEAMASPRHHQ